MAEAPRAMWRNGLTVVGGILAITAALFIVSLLVIDLTAAHPSPYIGLFTYLVLPVILVVALSMIFAGLWVARRRSRRLNGAATEIQWYPRFDFANSRHRRGLAAGAGGLALTLPIVGVLSYEGYHYTDSNQFCGVVCHTVMEPQFAAYQQSPHAHVNCAECHIGSGASWYVKSKLSGIRQVFAVAFDSFPRPIPPAIQELRPATETCQQCHWPSKFYGDQLVTIDHYASDEQNTHGRIRMLLKTGGSDPTTGPPSGIHWHMALGFTVEYVAVDDHLQEIPWVKATDHATKETRIYRSDGRPSTDPPPAGTRRTVDCMDCHNRPTHVFRSPEKAADSALHVHPALQSLPFAKRELVAVLSKPYAGREDGLKGIEVSLRSFYESQYPQVWNGRRADVDKLVSAALDIYRTTTFPEMNVNWRTYPDNIGHKIFPGCFRCHDDKHVDDSGKGLTHDCGACHEFLLPGDGTKGSNVVQVGGFVHPVPLIGSHAALRCDQCHTGGVAPDRTCAGCHSDVRELRAGNWPGWTGGKLPPDPMLDTVDCEACHNLARPTKIEIIDETCMDCHSEEEDRFKGMLAAWKKEVDSLLGPLEQSPAHQAIVARMKKAGPLHNIAATRAILGSENPSAPLKEPK